jgi:N-acyl-D-aspartate/D-glutamate deacylase
MGYANRAPTAEELTRMKELVARAMAEGALGAFYLGRALASKQEYDEALKAFEKAET